MTRAALRFSAWLVTLAALATAFGCGSSSSKSNAIDAGAAPGADGSPTASDDGGDGSLHDAGVIDATGGDATRPTDGGSGDATVGIPEGSTGKDGSVGMDAPGDTAEAAPPPDATGLDAPSAMDAANGTDASTCGDGVCESSETSLTCPQDCVLLCGDVAVDLSQYVMWDVAVSTYVTWDEANTFCASLTTDGHSDWILPSSAEDELLLGDCGLDGEGGDQCSTCADSPACNTMFPGDQGTYWNSTVYGTCCAGGADFFAGDLSVGYFKDGSGGPLLTRCFRSLTACSSGCLASETCSAGLCVPTDCTSGHGGG